MRYSLRPSQWTSALRAGLAVACRVDRRLSALLLVAAAAASPSARAQDRPQFDPTHDYAYDLTHTAATVCPVTLEDDGFAWPKIPAGADTAMLEIMLTATSGDEPRLASASPTGGVYQVFEAGARGRRFLDLSPLLAGTHAGDRVRLVRTGVTLQAGPTRLFVYANPPLTGQRVLVLGAHPDDAETAFGVYRRTQADIVTVTAGDAGGENFHVLYPDPATHYRIKGWVRTWDSISVPFYGGVYPGRARNLGYYDATLRRLRATPTTPVAPMFAKLDDPAYYRRLNVDPALRDRPFGGTWESLVGDLLWELERVRPTIVVAAHPLIDAHPDHEYMTIALIEALTRWSGSCELYLGLDHVREDESYPFGDRNAMAGLPPWSGGELFFSRLYSHPLTADEQRLKLIALEAMHDVRDFDLRDGTRTVPDAAALAEIRRYDYYRRSPRPNELFLVVTRADALRLRETFLATR